MRRVRTTRLVAGAAVIGLGLLALGTGLQTAQAKGTDSSSTDTSSAVTVSGTGRFSGVKVTVSQTTHLVNQVVHVTWSGATPTSPKVGSFDKNYMQIMQCWGDDTVPHREDCQYGAFDGDQRGGQWVPSRQVTYGSNLVDPHEPIKRPPGSVKNLSVPFDSVKGDSTTAFPNPYFDAYSTNEEPFGRTGSDGTGQDFFEVQTAQQAPGLGCGTRLSDGTGRACWLVVVPRDNTEVDGSKPDDRLQSSPLSESNWDNAIAVRLHFDPLGLSCPIGASERRLIGQEEVSEAVVRWQPVLCQATKSIFGFSQISDDLSRVQSQQPDPWLSFVSKPVNPEGISDGRSMTYAPVALDGIGIAFNMDKQPAYGATDDINEQAGERVTSLHLNARLVAKLLTQSYKIASYAPGFPKGNPGDLTRDPEFKALNPSLNPFYFNGIYQITVPEGLSDAYNELWKWVASDPDAKAFIDGKPDPWGTVVNPAYKGMNLDLESFPRADLTCKDIGGQSPLCPLDALAYAQDLHEATRGAARGDTLARNYWDPAANPAAYKKAPLQLSGQRQVLTLTDTATAARYSLPMASLKNASGNYVAPTEGSILRGLDAMKPSGVDGVLEPDPGAKGAGVYPLSHLTYALTAPSKLTAEEAKDYAAFLRYVAGAGQVPGIAPGQLPAGYVGLTPALIAQTERAATLIAARGGPSSSPSSAPTSSGSNSTPGGSNGGTTSPNAPSSAPAGGIAPPGTQPPSSAGVAPTQTVSFTTPKSATGAPRFVLLGALLLGLVAALVKPILVLVQRRRPTTSAT